MTDNDPISLSRAMWRGFLGKCPNCGKGHLFGHFLKVADHCEVCGEEFFHHRADDFPAYLVIVIVGHLVVPMVLAVETSLCSALLATFPDLDTADRRAIPRTAAAGQGSRGRDSVAGGHARLRSREAQTNEAGGTRPRPFGADAGCLNGRKGHQRHP